MRRAIYLLATALLLVACGDHPSPDGDRPAPSRLVGSRCGDAQDCESMCAGGGKFPGGFCTVPCFFPEDCPDGTVCVGEKVEDAVCVYPCAATLDCTIAGPGYVCKRRRDPTGDFQYSACIGD